jgi:hypothetical protein
MVSSPRVTPLARRLGRALRGELSSRNPAPREHLIVSTLGPPTNLTAWHDAARARMNWSVAAQSWAGGLILSVAGCAGTGPSSASQGSCTSSSVSGACNDLGDIGSLVNSTCAAGVVPTGTGGVIADGTYVLSAVVCYDCDDAGGPPSPQSQTVVISRGCLQGTGHLNGLQLSTTQSFIVSGSELTLALVCPPSQTGTQTTTFTATDASLTVFHPLPFSQAEVYSRH